MKPIPSKYFEDNKERFGAMHQDIEVFNTVCSHDVLKRPNPNTVECTSCHNGWKFDGQIPQVFLDRVDNTKPT